jgi:hypothetical protein
MIVLLGSAQASRLWCEPKKKIVSPAVKKMAMVKKAKPALEAEFKPFVIYTEQASRDNHYMPYGLMGDLGSVKIEQGCTDTPHSGKTCLKITYQATVSDSLGWAGAYWQQPANNWDGTQKGFNLTGARYLTFWARGAKGGETVSEFKVGGINIGANPDSDCVSFGPVTLTDTWQKYDINLKGCNLSNIIGGFCWAASRELNPSGFVIYLDDVIFE